MQPQQNKIKITSLILLILTIIWIVVSTISMLQVKPAWKDSDFIRWVSHPDIFFILNYINATLLTVVIIFLFSFIFTFLKPKYESIVIVGLVFIPIYGVINLLCYSIQISIVPSIAYNSLNNQYTVNIVSQLIQANSKSLIGFMNGMAYAIFGIPSIIYGILLIKELKKYSGIFLFINGIFCFVGIIGCLIGNSILEMGTMIGGVIFLISLIFMQFEFKYNE